MEVVTTVATTAAGVPQLPVSLSKSQLVANVGAVQLNETTPVVPDPLTVGTARTGAAREAAANVLPVLVTLSE